MVPIRTAKGRAELMRQLLSGSPLSSRGTVHGHRHCAFNPHPLVSDEVIDHSRDHCICTQWLADKAQAVSSGVELAYWS